MTEHGRVRVRMTRSPPVPPVGQESRPLKPLPMRALQMIERGVQEEAVNWKALFKLGENWRNGAYLPRLLHAGYYYLLTGRCTLQTFESGRSTSAIAKDMDPTDSEGMSLLPEYSPPPLSG